MKNCGGRDGDDDKSGDMFVMTILNVHRMSLAIC